MALNMVSIPLGHEPVFNEDDHITGLAIRVFVQFCCVVYNLQVGADRTGYMGYCHDRYVELVESREFPIVIDEHGDDWQATTIFFNVINACYDLHFIAFISTLTEIHKTQVVTEIHSVRIRHHPRVITDVFLYVRQLITGPAANTEKLPDEPYPDFAC